MVHENKIHRFEKREQAFYLFEFSEKVLEF